MSRFPEFGQELRRPFVVADECYDCAEFYDGCNAWPASKHFRCADYLRLPDVGIDGQTGQVFPPSRMNGRKEPRAIGDRPRPEPIEPTTTTETPAPVELPVEPANRSNGRTPSPASRPGPDGKRFCACGAVLPKRRRCCDACRQERREKAVRRWLNQRTPRIAG